MEDKRKETANKIVNVIFLVTFLVAIVMSVVLIITYLFRGGSKSDSAVAPGAQPDEVIAFEEPLVEESVGPKYTEEQLAMLPEAEEIYAEILRRIEIKDYYAIEYYANQILWYEDVAQIKEYYDNNTENVINEDVVKGLLEMSAYDTDGYNVIGLCSALLALKDLDGFEDTFQKGVERLKELVEIQYEMGSYNTASNAYACLTDLGAGDYSEKSADAKNKAEAILGEYSGKKYGARTIFMSDGLYIMFTPKNGNTLDVYTSIFDGEWNFYFDANYTVTFDENKMVVSSTGGMFDGEYRRK